MAERCQSVLREIHRYLGGEFSRCFDVRFLTASEAIAQYDGPLSQYPRSYLPVWKDGDGNYAGLHLDPDKTWTDQAWVMLRHDGSYPELIASSFRVLPRVLHLTALSYPDMSTERWRQLKELAHIIPGAQEFDVALQVVVPDPEWADTRAALDPDNTLEVLISNVNACETVEMALEAILGLLAKHPDDPFVHAALAIAKSKAGVSDACKAAREAMLYEYAWRSDRRIDILRVWPELMDIWGRLGQIAFESNEPAGALEPFRGEDVLMTNQACGAAIEVSRRFAASGNSVAALHVARNGYTLAALLNELSDEWLEWMRTVTASVAPESLASELLAP